MNQLGPALQTSKNTIIRILLFYFRALRKIIRIVFNKWTCLVAVGIFLPALLGYMHHLDKIVTAKFQGKRFSVPIRVYARSLELYSGKALLKQQLQKEFELLNYHRVERVENPGEYADYGDYVVFFSRDFHYWDGALYAQRTRLTFANGFVSTLQNHDTGMDLAKVRLEPLLISGANGGQYEDRQLIDYEQVPQELINALIAVEDQRFYQHHGVDLKSLLRATASTLSGRGIQGGSTITQQLVKNFLLTPERTLKRKLNEMLMAIILEFRFSKKEILETYLNEVYFGQDGSRAIHGVELASQFYFGRSVAGLELQQSAMLVAMLKGPTYYNPRRNPERALERRNLVLEELYQQGLIDKELNLKAKAKPLGAAEKVAVVTTEYPNFLDLVFRQLREEYSDLDANQDGLSIFTTLDPVEQYFAESALAQGLQALEQQKNLPSQHLEGAIVIAEPKTGEVTALIGSRNPRYEGFNRALDAKRQIGSLIKPAVYLTALTQTDNYNLATLLDDTELSWQEPGAALWQPHNYDNQYHGAIPFWLSLAHSYNVSTARLGLELGIQNIIDTVHTLGVEAPLNPYASIVLGTPELAPFEVAQMYQVLAAGGIRIPLQSIRAVQLSSGELILPNHAKATRVVAARANYLLTRSLQLAVREGTGKGLQRFFAEDLQLAGKTGTTDNLRDSWFAGYSDDRLGIVWIGNDHNKSSGLTGASGALTIWGQLFSSIAMANLSPQAPHDVKEFYVDRSSGRQVSSHCENAITLPFVVGTEPDKQFGCHAGVSGGKGLTSWISRFLGQ